MKRTIDFALWAWCCRHVAPRGAVAVDRIITDGETVATVETDGGRIAVRQVITVSVIGANTTASWVR